MEGPVAGRAERFDLPAMGPLKSIYRGLGIYNKRTQPAFFISEIIVSAV